MKIIYEGKELAVKWLTYYNKENDNIVQGPLIEPIKIKTPIGKYEVDVIMLFKDSQELEGVHFREMQIIKTDIGNLKTSSLHFYKNGQIESVDLDFFTKIKTIFGEIEISSKYSGLYFYKNGNIKKFWLLNPIKVKTAIGDLTLQKELSFYKNGKLKSGYSAGNFIHNIKFNKDFLFNFEKNGNLIITKSD